MDKRFCNKRKGELGFIADNGKHFNDIDINKLNGYPIFVINRLIDQEDVRTTYYVINNGFFEEKDIKHIKEIKKDYDVSHRYINRYKNSILTVKGEPFFQADINKPIWDSEQSLFVAIQLAYFMGIDPIIIIGLDFDKNLIGSVFEKSLLLSRLGINSKGRKIYNGSSFTRLSYEIIPNITLNIFKD